MTVDELVAATHAQMKARSDQQFLEGVRNFFVEPVDPWGVRSADLKFVEQMVYRELKGMSAADRNKYCNELWKHGKLEDGVLICHVYRRFASQCGACEFKLFERWIDKYVHNWANCDSVSSWLLSAAIANEPALKSELPAWTKSPQSLETARGRGVAVAGGEERPQHGRHLSHRRRTRPRS